MQPFATFDELQLHLGRTLDDQFAAEQALMLSSGAVRSYCRWEISRNTSAAMQSYGDGSHLLSLPTLLLNTVISISVDGVDIGPIVWSQDLNWGHKGQIHRTGGWCKDAIVDVVCDHGYDPDELPDAIKLVALDAASRQLINPENLVSAATGEVSRSWSSSTGSVSGLSTLHQVLLDNYRLM
jgi:hypothetical protein